MSSSTLRIFKANKEELAPNATKEPATDLSRKSDANMQRKPSNTITVGENKHSIDVYLEKFLDVILVTEEVTEESYYEPFKKYMCDINNYRFSLARNRKITDSVSDYNEKINRTAIELVNKRNAKEFAEKFISFGCDKVLIRLTAEAMYSSSLQDKKSVDFYSYIVEYLHSHLGSEIVDKIFKDTLLSMIKKELEEFTKSEDISATSRYINCALLLACLVSRDVIETKELEAVVRLFENSAFTLGKAEVLMYLYVPIAEIKVELSNYVRGVLQKYLDTVATESMRLEMLIKDSLDPENKPIFYTKYNAEIDRKEVTKIRSLQQTNRFASLADDSDTEDETDENEQRVSNLRYHLQQYLYRKGDNEIDFQTDLSDIENYIELVSQYGEKSFKLGSVFSEKVFKDVILPMDQESKEKLGSKLRDLYTSDREANSKKFKLFSRILFSFVELKIFDPYGSFQTVDFNPGIIIEFFDLSFEEGYIEQLKSFENITSLEWLSHINLKTPVHFLDVFLDRFSDDKYDIPSHFPLLEMVGTAIYYSDPSYTEGLTKIADFDKYINSDKFWIIVMFCAYKLYKGPLEEDGPDSGFEVPAEKSEREESLNVLIEKNKEFVSDSIDWKGVKSCIDEYCNAVNEDAGVFAGLYERISPLFEKSKQAKQVFLL